ncbi:LURP-one-related/scramblase family protein [Aquirufa sp. ROCK2-A2]
MNNYSQKFSFFNLNTYFIDEKVNMFKFENTYHIFDDQGAQVGAVKQKLSFGQKLQRILLDKKILPFLLEIKNANDEVEASISRGWTFFLSKIEIKNGQGFTVAYIQQKFKLFKPKFVIFDENNLTIATISGDWKAWDFSIRDGSDVEIGIITKKWAGALKEIFTSADKYKVEINPNLTLKEHRAIILSAAITIDMVLKEST